MNKIASDHGIKVEPYLVSGPSKNFSGAFYPELKTLKYPILNRYKSYEWLEIAVHEYSHMLQFIFDRKRFNKLFDKRRQGSVYKFHEIVSSLEFMN